MASARLWIQWAVALLVSCAAVIVSRSAHAAPAVIESGRERDVLALFAPFELGAEVRAGYKLWDVSIEPTRIKVGLKGPDGASAGFTLVEPSQARGDAERSFSFAVALERAPSPGAKDAVSALVEAVRRNDRGGIWTPIGGLSSGAGEGGPHERGAEAWLTDGLVLMLVGLGLLLVLVRRALAGSSRTTVALLAGSVLVALLVRLLLSEPTILGAWGFSRLTHPARLLAEGPAIAALAGLFDTRFYLTELIAWQTLAFAVATPLAIFVLARCVLPDARAAIAAAWLVALLPQHIRFSRSEVEFIPTIVLACIGFGLLDVWLRGRTDVWRRWALAALVLLLVGLVRLRPLNELFVVLFVAASWILHRDVPRARRIGFSAIAVLLGVWAVRQLVAEQAPGVDEGLSLRTLGTALRVVVSPSLNTLIDPTKTPPGLLIAAVVGAVLSWRAGHALRVVFLLGWLGAFLVAHAAVPEPTMQARYHLTLVVPFVLLAASALPALLDRSRRGFIAAAVYAASMPLVHASFIRDLDYAEIAEYQFLKDVRSQLPDACTIVEWVGPDRNEHEAHWPRASRYVGEDGPRDRFEIIAARHVDGAIDERTQTTLRRPPKCLYLYEGLHCHGQAPASGCAELMRLAPSERIAGASIPARALDAASAPELRTDIDEVPIALHRVRQDDAPAEAAVVLPSPPPRSPAPWRLPAWTTWLVAGFALAWSASRIMDASRDWKRLRSASALKLLGLLAVVTLVSVFVPDRLPLHEHSSFVARSDCAYDPRCEDDPRGPGWLAPVFRVYRVLLQLLPYRVQNLGWISLALSLTSLVLLYLLVRTLFEHFGQPARGERVALWSLAFLGLQPVWLRVAVSDTFWPYVMCCLLAAGLALLHALRSTNPFSAGAAAAFLALAAASNLVCMTLLGLAVLAPLSWKRGPVRHWRRFLLLVPFVPYVAGYVYEAYELAFVRGGGALTGSSGFAGLLERMAANFTLVFFDARIVPAPLAVYLLLGLWFARAHWRELLPFVYVLFALQPFTSLWSGHPLGPSYPVGFINVFPTLMCLALLSACGAEWLVDRVAPRLRAPMTAGVAALALGFLPTAREGLQFLTGSRVLERELVALSHALEVIPPHDVLVIPPVIQEPPPELRRGRDPVEAVFPVGEYRYVMRSRGLPPGSVLESDQFLVTRARKGDRVLLYLGSTYKSFLPEEIALPGFVTPELERPALIELKKRYTLEPVHEFRMQTAQHPLIGMRLGADRVPEVTLGFYWLRARN